MLDWFTKLFLFTLYIRVIVEAILFIFVSVMLEITQFESAHDHPLSYTISWLSLIVIIIATMLIPKHYFDYREYSNIDSEYFSELYNGTKDTKICKLYTFIFIMRRLITAFLIVFFQWHKRNNNMQAIHIHIYHEKTDYCVFDSVFEEFECMAKMHIFHDSPDCSLDIFNHL